MEKVNLILLKFRGISVLLIILLLLTPFKGLAETLNTSAKPNTKDVQQQSFKLTGKVLDNEGLPLIGVSIREQGTQNATITDLSGEFSIQVNPQSVLTISYIGFVTQTIKIENQKKLSIILLEDSQNLEEVVIVGYGSQKKVSVTGAVAAVQTKELKQSSAANLSSALSGRLPGLTALQTSGRPGGDDVELYLRGQSTTNGASPLIMIDGVPRDNMSTLDPNEIASISILKDASATAVFGVRGANGVIIITTRRGEPGKSELSISVDYSLQQFTAKPDRIHSWDFAEMRNQAFLNDGYSKEDLPYNDYMIEMYRSGQDPVFYPDRDVYKDYFKDWTPQTRVNVNMSGGSDKITYFLNVGYLGQNGQFRTEDEEKLGYDPSYKTDRFNFRANIDYNIASNLKLSLNLASYLEKVNSPQTRELFESNIDMMIHNMMGGIRGTAPNYPGPYTVDGYTTLDGKAIPGGQIIHETGEDRNTFGEINRRGYRKETKTNLNSSLILDWGLGFITEGLSTKFMVSFDSRALTDLQGVRAYDTYGVIVAKSAEEKSYYTEQHVNVDDAIRLYKGASSRYFTNLQYSINYARQFGLHDFSALALAQRDNWQEYAADLPYNMIGLSGRFTYAYDSRYLAEINLGYNGSEQFAKGRRFGFFPAVSGGWIVSNENFMRENPIITHLKLRASYGKVGNDKLGGRRFLYNSEIQLGGGSIPSLGLGKYVSQGLIGNPLLSWETSFKQNYGVDIKLFHDLSLTLDYYKEKRDNVLIARRSVSEILGYDLNNVPKMNMGIIDNSGYEIEVAYHKQLNNDWSFTVKGNFAYNHNKQRFMDEAAKSDDFAYSHRLEGYSIGQIFGYKIDYSNGNGYINTQEELDKATEMYTFGIPRMGDFIYVDVNEDGIIDEKDESPIKYSNVPRISYGFSGSVNWKDFDFSFLFSGIGKVSRTYLSAGAIEYTKSGFYSDYHLEAWTPERYANGEEIKYPALSSRAGVSHRSNDFYTMDRSFLRLKNIELGYSFPKSLLNKIKVSNARVYVNGNNLLTWSALRTKAIDPEQTVEINYPITRMINFGVNVAF